MIAFESLMVTRVDGRNRGHDDYVTLGATGLGIVHLELDQAQELGAALIRAARPEATRSRRARGAR